MDLVERSEHVNQVGRNLFGRLESSTEPIGSSIQDLFPQAAAYLAMARGVLVWYRPIIDLRIQEAEIRRDAKRLILMLAEKTSNNGSQVTRELINVVGEKIAALKSESESKEVELISREDLFFVGQILKPLAAEDRESKERKRLELDPNKKSVKIGEAELALTKMQYEVLEGLLELLSLRGLPTILLIRHIINGFPNPPKNVSAFVGRLIRVLEKKFEDDAPLYSPGVSGGLYYLEEGFERPQRRFNLTPQSEQQ